MKRKRLAVAWAAGLTVSALCATQPARAANRATEAAARQVLERAASDFATMNYETAASRLNKMVRRCTARHCKAATRAALLRDLGVMQLRMGDFGASKKSWAAAIKLEPDIELGSTYDASDLREAFNAARGIAPATPQQPSGDFDHTPATAVKTGTPLVVYFEYRDQSPLGRVVVKYEGESEKDWTRLGLKRIGGGWGGVIPCGATTKGTLRYWVEGFDENDDPVGSSGDPKHPYQVTVRDDVTTPPPTLPGMPPPTCAQSAAPAPAPVSNDNEEAPPEETPSPPPKSGQPYARFWFGVSGALDFLSLPSANNACLLDATAHPAGTTAYYCVAPNGSDFPSRVDGGKENGELVHGQAGNVAGGVQSGDLRVMITFDYALSPSFLLGARLGYVLDSYPGRAAVQQGRAFGSSVEVEARATYLFGNEPLARVGFAPMVFGGLGLAPFDGHTTTAVSLSNVAGQLPVDAWLTGGPFFVDVGGGVRYAFSARFGFTLAARLNLAVGGGGLLPTYGPEIGLAYGF